MKKVTSKDGTVIAYDQKGTGPVLILVLGALNKRGSGKKLTDLLSDSFTVISYDRRGRGDSTEVLPYSTSKEVGDLEAIIDAAGGKASLYGHSSGSVLALMAAQRLGDKISNVAIYELPYNGDPEAIKAAEAYRHDLQHLIDTDQRGDAVALFVKSVGVTDNQISAMKKLPMWKGLTAMAPTLVYDAIKLMEEYPTMQIETIETPALVMYGAASPDFMAETATKIAHVMPYAKLEALEGQHHDVKAAVLAPILATFLKA